MSETQLKFRGGISVTTSCRRLFRIGSIVAPVLSASSAASASMRRASMPSAITVCAGRSEYFQESYCGVLRSKPTSVPPDRFHSMRGSMPARYVRPLPPSPLAADQRSWLMLKLQIGLFCPLWASCSATYTQPVGIDATAVAAAA